MAATSKQARRAAKKQRRAAGQAAEAEALFAWFAQLEVDVRVDACEVECDTCGLLQVANAYDGTAFVQTGFDEAYAYARPCVVCGSYSSAWRGSLAAAG